MQVSWIDADALRVLAAKLQEPLAAQAAPRAVPPVPSAFLPDTLTPTKTEETPISNDSQLARIREQLQSIRSKALQAGLLTESPAPASAATSTRVASVFQIDEVETAKPAAPAVTEPVAATSTPSPVEKMTPAATPRDPMSGRLDIFARMARQVTNSDDLMLMDEKSEIIWSNTTRHEVSLSAALSLATALHAPTLPSVLRSRLTHNRELTVLPCPTRYGTVILAMVNARVLRTETVNELRAALKQAVEG